MQKKHHVRFRRASPMWHAVIVILILYAWHRTAAQVQASNLSSSLPTPQVNSVCNPLGTTTRFHNSSKRTLQKQQAEWDLGTELASSAEQNAEMITDELIVAYLNRVEQNIVIRSALPGCFVVKILVDPEPNASSLPGGFIYVTTGLIALSESEGELAAALAHETAHVTAHHLSKFLTRSRAWGRVAFMAGPAGYLLRRYLGPLLMFDQIRGYEFEADRLGLQYQVTSGYDLWEFCTLLQRAIPQPPKGVPILDRLYNTHPATSERVRRLESLMGDPMSLRVNAVVSTSEFQDMKAQFESVMAHNHFSP